MQPRVLAITIGEFLGLLLDDDCMNSTKEEAKIRAISEWLEAGFKDGNVDARIDDFPQLISKVQLKSVSQMFLRELWNSGRGVGRIPACK